MHCGSPVPVQRLGNKRMLKMFQAAKNRERKVYGATYVSSLLACVCMHVGDLNAPWRRVRVCVCVCVRQ